MPRYLEPIEDSDMDSLFILPLNSIPLETVPLGRARLIKNVRLKTMVELFSDVQTGSGQIEVDSLGKIFEWPTDKVHPDLIILRQLALIPSYDVYSLRIALRQLGIKVNDHVSLQLSEEKKGALSDYMVAFTHPLVKMIYADDNVHIDSYDDLIKLFQDPDIAKARERLIAMANSLQIEPMDVPHFLEDCGDTFMALSYYQHCLDRLEPYFTACIESLAPIRSNFKLSQNDNLMKCCRTIEESINSVTASISGRLESFSKRTNSMWKNVTQEEFLEIKSLIERYHVTIGAALCGLTVKMNAFARAFPHPQAGGPGRRADFLLTEMIHGIEAIKSADAVYSQRTGAPR